MKREYYLPTDQMVGKGLMVKSIRPDLRFVTLVSFGFSE